MFLNFDLERLIYVIPAIIIALVFHEYAHARIAYAFGDPTAKSAGRMTLNPLKHLDPIGTLLLIFAGFGWAKPVPVNPFYFQGNRKGKMLLVSLGGPLMNLAEAVVGALCFALIFNFAPYNGVSDYFLHLTDVGRKVAEQIYEKHRFFTERLIEAGVDPETAERDACRIEHVISDESFRRLKAVAKSES